MKLPDQPFIFAQKINSPTPGDRTIQPLNCTAIYPLDPRLKSCE